MTFRYKIGGTKQDIHFLIRSTTEIGPPCEIDDVEYWMKSDISAIITCYKGSEPVGVSIFEDVSSEYRILNHIGVRKDFRMHGVGVRLFKHSLHPNEDIPLRMVVPSESVYFNKWLRNRGCTAKRFQKNYWPEQCGKKDAVIMEY